MLHSWLSGNSPPADPASPIDSLDNLNMTNAADQAVIADTMRIIAGFVSSVSSVMAGGVWIVDGNRISSDSSARRTSVTHQRRQCSPSFAPDITGVNATSTRTTRCQSRSGRTYDSIWIIYGRDAMPVTAARRCVSPEGPVGGIK